MLLSSGDRFGPYTLISPLGEGGMGVVWKARDTRLDRTVALKVSKADFSERFEREARAVAALNHPNICTLHDVGPNYLVMELIEGEPLRGPMPVEKAVAYAGQILDALDAAHRKGITHRDLKPANILVTKQGIKLLDFGLAKQAGPPKASDATLTAALTGTGQILGTLQYMSPEQLQGKEADARSDLFSFGCVLCEMLTGKHAFKGESAAIAAILEWEARALEPEGLNRVVRACLAKDPADRFQTARDLKRALEWSVSGDGETPLLEGAPEPGGARRLWLGWGVAAALAVGLAPIAFLHLREKPPAPATPLRFQIPAENATGSLSLSPDGRKLAFLVGDRLWVQFLESGESRDLTAAEPGVPFWSPDSRFIGYTSQGKLKKIEATGSPPQTVTDLRSNLWGGGAWNQDDVIVFGDRPLGLFRVPASGGVPVQITALDPARHENSQYCPSFLPDGRHFVYIRSSTDEGKSAIYLGSVDARPEQQSSKALVASNSQPVYAPSADPSTGYLLFIHGVTLMAQPFDNRRLELKGQAAPVAEQVRNNIAGASYIAFSASANDVLVFPRSRASGRQVTWFGREGKVMETVGEPGAYGSLGNLALSPDGTRLAVTKNSRGADTGNIWLLDLSRGGASTRFTFGSLVDTNPVWSPDGSRMIFSSNRDGPYNLYQKPANGVKDEEVLLKSSEDKFATSWSRDGRFLLHTVAHQKTKNDLWVLPLDNDKKPVPFLSTEFDERQARFSPDGHWVAYTSNESGQDEVYVRPFSMNSAGTAVEAGGKWPISNGPGVNPRWRGDGRELYYQSRGGRILAVEIATNPAFRAGPPQPLGLLTSALWDSAADGRRFLSLANKSEPQPYTVVLNWQAGLKK
jgi:Tol biopolymer transport system component/predicted Ser/Thr protein kinase